ncbi:hypothetical protein U0070_023241 [Myodes glareolus]|uniref:Uncharacterized protein n=1 Tax=Myodes glareolus TaxID=447135 RepID=A0AAW0HBL2_MYOGA
MMTDIHVNGKTLTKVKKEHLDDYGDASVETDGELAKRNSLYYEAVLRLTHVGAKPSSGMFVKFSPV